MLPKLGMLVLPVAVYLRSELMVQLLPIQQSDVVLLLAAPKKRTEGVLTSLKNASDDDGYGSAPSSGSDVSTCVEQLPLCAVNRDNNFIAKGWLDNKPVNFISTSDTTEVVKVMRQIRYLKVLITAPLTVARYNRFMGGVNKHDKLCSTFSLGK